MMFALTVVLLLRKRSKFALITFILFTMCIVAILIINRYEKVETTDTVSSDQLPVKGGTVVQEHYDIDADGKEVYNPYIKYDVPENITISDEVKAYLKKYNISNENIEVVSVTETDDGYVYILNPEHTSAQIKVANSYGTDIIELFGSRYTSGCMGIVYGVNIDEDTITNVENYLVSKGKADELCYVTSVRGDRIALRTYSGEEIVYSGGDK